ncbi:MAG: hypothetical protein P1U56_13515 [Saprospiraceae bacterium]|nr:hypothetical protein [Saprospiraceae bacterium]
MNVLLSFNHQRFYKGILVLLAFSIPLCTMSQETKPNKNAMYITFGSAIIPNQVSISYERTILTEDVYKVGIKAHVGRYLSNYGGLDLESGEKIIENHMGISGLLSMGQFEVNLGAVNTQYKLAKGEIVNPDIDYDKLSSVIIPYINVAMRFEKEDHVLKIGFGNIELFHFSAGFKF